MSEELSALEKATISFTALRQTLISKGIITNEEVMLVEAALVKEWKKVREKFKDEAMQETAQALGLTPEEVKQAQEFMEVVTGGKKP